MSLYSIEFSSSALRDLKKLPKSEAERIHEKILGLAENPRPPGCVKLAGSGELYRIRVGNYRVIYSINDGILVVIILRIAHRREVYR